MKKLLAPLLILSHLTVVVPSWADPITLPSTITLPELAPVKGEPDVGAAVSPLKKGQLAPFSGVLLSPRATATIVAQINSTTDRIKLEVDHAQAEAAAHCDYEVSEVKTHAEADGRVLQAQVDERDKRLAILNEQLKQEEANRTNTPLWVGLGAGAGVVVGIGLTVLTAYAVNRAAK